MMSKLGTAMLILAIGLLFAVLASLVPSDFWLLRTVDLVREPLSYLASALLVISLFCRWQRALDNDWSPWPSDRD